MLLPLCGSTREQMLVPLSLQSKSFGSGAALVREELAPVAADGQRAFGRSSGGHAGRPQHSEHDWSQEASASKWSHVPSMEGRRD